METLQADASGLGVEILSVTPKIQPAPQQVNVVALSPTEVSSFWEPVAGAIGYQVDGSDVAVVDALMGSVLGDAAYHARVDLDPNGKIDAYDRAEVSWSVGQPCGSPPAPPIGGVAELIAPAASEEVPPVTVLGSAVPMLAVAAATLAVVLCALGLGWARPRRL